jgi:hypothetical protein
VPAQFWTLGCRAACKLTNEHVIIFVDDTF